MEKGEAPLDPVGLQLCRVKHYRRLFDPGKMFNFHMT